jgi:hypothetical protein
MDLTIPVMEDDNTKTTPHIASLVGKYYPQPRLWGKMF